MEQRRFRPSALPERKPCCICTIISHTQTPLAGQLVSVLGLAGEIPDAAITPLVLLAWLAPIGQTIPSFAAGQIFEKGEKDSNLILTSLDSTF